MTNKKKKYKYSREIEWQDFADIVCDHVVNYTIKQYGDAPKDEVWNWTEKQCMGAISKYVKRFGSKRRGELEEMRDLVKIAHFAAMIFYKKCLQTSYDDIPDFEDIIKKIRKGKS